MRSYLKENKMAHQLRKADLTRLRQAISDAHTSLDWLDDTLGYSSLERQEANDVPGELRSVRDSVLKIENILGEIEEG